MKTKKLLSMVLAISTLFTLASCSVSKKIIDLKDYVTVTFNSYNGYSTPAMEIDYNGFIGEIDSEKMVKYFKKVCPEDAQLYNQYGDDRNIATYFSIEFEENYQRLSNGDKVVVKAVVSSEMENAGQTIKDVEKGLGIKFKEATFTVEGLKEAKGLEIIKDISEWVTYEGVSEGCTAEIDGPDEMNLQIDDFYFTTSERNINSISVVHNNTSLGTISVYFKETSSINAPELKKGDTVHVYLTGDAVFNALDEAGYAVAQTEFEITVPDLGEYVTDKDKLTEKNIKTIQDALLAKVIEKKGNGKLISVYFAKAKPGVACEEGRVGLVVAIAEVTDGISNDRTSVVVAEVNTIIKNSKGEISFKTNNGYMMSYGSTEQEAYTKGLDHENYTFEKIG